MMPCRQATRRQRTGARREIPPCFHNTGSAKLQVCASLKGHVDFPWDKSLEDGRESNSPSLRMSQQTACVKNDFSLFVSRWILWQLYNNWASHSCRNGVEGFSAIPFSVPIVAPDYFNGLISFASLPLYLLLPVTIAMLTLTLLDDRAIQFFVCLTWVQP